MVNSLNNQNPNNNSSGEEVRNIIGGEIQEKISSDVLNILGIQKCQLFLQVIDSGELILNFESIQIKELSVFLDNIFDKGFYLENINYTLLQDILLERKLPNTGKIKLADKISKIPEHIQNIIQKPKISPDNMEAFYAFSPIYDDLDLSNNSPQEQTIIPIDMFIASMWSYGIKVGIKYNNISQALLSDDTSVITIAEGIPAIDPIPPKLQSLILLGSDYSFIEKELSTKLSLKDYKRVFPWVDIGTKIYKKTPLIPGKDGKNILNQTLKPQSVKDFEMSKIYDKGVELIEENGVEYIVAEKKGFVHSAIGYYRSIDKGEDSENLLALGGHEISKKISITDNLKIESIGMKTGNLSIPFSIDIEKDIERNFFLKALEANIEGFVAGKLLCEGDILIKGGITGEGNSLEKIFFEKTGGEVISKNGNIKIPKVVTSSFISAKNGEIEIQTSDRSIIYGKNIKIQKAYNSIIIGENISISKEVSGCTFINLGDLKILHLKEGKDAINSIISVYSAKNYCMAKKLEEEIIQLSDQNNSCIEDFKTLEKELEVMKQNKQLQNSVSLYSKKTRGVPLSYSDLGYLELPHIRSQLRDYAKKISQRRVFLEKKELIAKTIEENQENIKKYLKLHEGIKKPTTSIRLSTGVFYFGSIGVFDYEDIGSINPEMTKNLLDYLNKSLEHKYLGEIIPINSGSKIEL